MTSQKAVSSAARYRSRKVRRAILGLITAYRRLEAKDKRQLRKDIVELLTNNQEIPNVDYIDVCRALDWLFSRRLINMGHEGNGGSFAVSPR